MGSACSLNDDETELKGVVKSRVQLRPDHRRPVKPRSEMGPPELLEASLLGDMKQAGWVLETDGNAHGVPTCTGWLPLHVSAAQGHLDIARALLRRKAEVNPPSDSLSAISPLSLACLSGQASLVQLLLCAAATIDGPEGHGGAPLLHAAYKNFASICEILLDSGANPHVAFTKSGHIQLELPAAKTPLHDDHWHRILCEPSQGGSSLQQLRTEGVTALHLAAWHGSARTCWALLEAAARPDARDCLHRSALMLSAERGHLEVVRLLLERRAHLHPSLHGHTAASLAARANQTAAIELLLEGKVDVDYVAWFGAPTMLHIAAYWRYQGLVSKLLTLKASTESPLAPGGLRPLMVAADRGSLEVCQLLLGFSAEVGALDDAGESAWQKAVLAGNLKIGHLLAACGAASALKVGPSRGEKEASEV